MICTILDLIGGPSTVLATLVAIAMVLYLARREYRHRRARRRYYRQRERQRREFWGWE